MSGELRNKAGLQYIAENIRAAVNNDKGRHYRCGRCLTRMEIPKDTDYRLVWSKMPEELLQCPRCGHKLQEWFIRHLREQRADNSSLRDTIAAAYRDTQDPAQEEGIKGTNPIFQDSTDDKKDTPAETPNWTYHEKCGCTKDLYVTVTDDPETGELLEVFISHGKAGGCGAANKEALGKTISIAVRSGANPLDLAKALDGITCPKAVVHPDPVIAVKSCITVVSHAIQEHERKKRE